LTAAGIISNTPDCGPMARQSPPLASYCFPQLIFYINSPGAGHKRPLCGILYAVQYRIYGHFFMFSQKPISLVKYNSSKILKEYMQTIFAERISENFSLKGSGTCCSVRKKFYVVLGLSPKWRRFRPIEANSR
jgi:hypothetical protein